VDLLLVLYLVIGVASFLVLIVIMLLGGLDLDFDGGPDIDFDIGDVDVDIDAGGGPGLFSLPVVLSFTSAFGGLGAIMTYFDVDPVITPFIAAGSSLVFAVLLFMIVRYSFKVFSSDSTVKYDRLKGKKATVTVPINPGMEGQVTLFTEQRGRTLIPAVADRKFGNNAEVVIIQNLGDSVRVASFSEWKRRKSGSKKGMKNPREREEKMKKR
jgi:membrane protein implicated in regulation of membrane protease activity